MKIPLIIGLAICGVVVGNVHRQAEDEIELMLHKKEWTKDSAEELERKWSFEVG